MAKIAKLITVCLVTRVVIEDTDSNQKILDKAKPEFMMQIINHLDEAIDSIVDDTELPSYNDKLRGISENLNTIKDVNN